MNFIVCVIEGRQIYFRGRMKIELHFTDEIGILRQLDTFVEIGKQYICKHLKNKVSTHQIVYIGEDFSFEDTLIFEYKVFERLIKVLFKRVGPLSYALARFFLFI